MPYLPCSFYFSVYCCFISVFPRYVVIISPLHFFFFNFLQLMFFMFKQQILIAVLCDRVGKPLKEREKKKDSFLPNYPFSTLVPREFGTKVDLSKDASGRSSTCPCPLGYFTSCPRLKLVFGAVAAAKRLLVCRPRQSHQVD